MSVIAPACSILDHSTDCFTASWYLIWDQVRYWLLVQVPILAFSIAYEWLELSSLKYVEQFRKLCDSPLTNVVNYLVQIVTSFYVCIYWIVRGGSLSVSFSSWSIESLFLIATGVGYGIRWLAAKNKVTFVLELHNVFDLLSMVAHFALSFQTIIVQNKHVRSWLDFGFLRSYVGYVVVTHLFTRYPHKTFVSQALLVVFKALFLVFFFAAVQFSLEQLGELPHTNSFLLHVYQCRTLDGSKSILRATNEGTSEYPTCTETWSFFSSIYFMFVTVSTVGYGDVSPHTVLGQLTVCLVIVFGIYTFANESAAFVTLYGDERGTLLTYKSTETTAHVIVTGTPSVAQLKDFIREFFHPDHDEALQFYDSDKQDKQTVETPSRKRHPNRYSSLHEAYIAMEEGEGEEDQLKQKPMQWMKEGMFTWFHRSKSSIRETHLVVLMHYKPHDASFQHAIRTFVEQHPHYHKRVFLVHGSPLRAMDLHHAQLARARAVFFLPNKDADDENQQDAATVFRVLSVLQIIKHEATQLFALLLNSANRTLLEATGFNKANIVCQDEIRLGLMGLSCRCPGLSTVVSNLITSRSEHHTPSSVNLWLSEYISGAAKEIYASCLARRFHGLSFIDASRAIHRQSNGSVLLIAVEAENKLAFNPGHEFSITSSTKAYLIADSFASLDPFAGVPHLDPIAALIQNPTMQTTLECLSQRARQAQSTVERRIPHAIRHAMAQVAASDPPLAMPLPPPRQVLEQGGHIVVCSHLNGQLTRLVKFLRPLRAPHVDRLVPIVLVDVTPFDTRSWRQLYAFGHVYHVQGSPQHHDVLAAAGMYTASSIVVLAQDGTCHDKDSKALFNAMLIHSALLERKAIFTLIELRDATNDHFLDPVACFSTEQQAREDDEFIDSTCRRRLSSAQRESSVQSIQQINWMVSATQAWTAVQTFFLGRFETAAQQVHSLGTQQAVRPGDESTFFHARFMKGALFPSHVADDLLLQSFFHPSLNHFVRQILDGQSCFALYKVPNHLRQRPRLLYRDLFDAMTSGCAHTLPIGLFRAPGGANQAPSPYVYTCPASTTIVDGNDQIFVLLNVQALNQLATKLQRRFRQQKKRKRSQSTC